ncbi:MAG: hypothetical protein RLP44_06430 [Aggregatilineales bacterium]
MKPFLIFLSLIILCITPIRAQDTLPPNFPPDPADLFDPRLQVVDVELIPPMPFADMDTQQIRVFDALAGDWHSFPFPADFTDRPSIKAWEQNTYLIYSVNIGAWVLDAENGTYQEMQMVCGGHAPTLIGDGEWFPMIVWNDISTGDIDTMRLCFTETDELTEPLPTDIDWFYCCGALSVNTTGEWLILTATAGEVTVETQTYGPTWYVYYGYEIKTGNLHRIGELPTRLEFSFPPGVSSGWVDDTHGILYDFAGGESSPDDFYAFNVTQPDSLQLFMHGWLLWSSWEYIDYNQSYQTLETSAQVQYITGSRITDHQPCILYIYDTYGIREFELGYDCLAAHFFYADGAYYTIQADTNQSETSTLLRVDSLTGEITELFMGEIEGFLQLSPDGRYATLMMDNNGQVDRVDYYQDGALGAVNSYGLESPSYITVDLQTGQQIEIVTDISRFVYDQRNPFYYLFNITNEDYSIRIVQHTTATTFVVEVTPRNYNGYPPPRAIYTLEYHSD